MTKGKLMTTDSTRPVWPFKEYGKLTPHPRKRWCKKIGGKVVYFGPWRNPDLGDEFAKDALKRYLSFMQSRANETEPEAVRAQDLTLFLAVNHFLNEKRKQSELGKLSPRQFVEYRNLGGKVLMTLGNTRLVRDLRPGDFARLRGAITQGVGPQRAANCITWTKSIFKFAQEFYIIAPNYGGQFKKPSHGEIRKAKREPELFTALEIQAVLKVATPALRAMILLGINGGYGQTDCATLPVMAVDLQRRMITYPRPKNNEYRITPLWPETVKALRAYHRPSPAHPELFFVTAHGNPWVHTKVHLDEAGVLVKTTPAYALSWEFNKALKVAKVKERGFYTLRHTFRTIADDTGDQTAIRTIMGHSSEGMDGHYLQRQGQSEDRLRGVVERVRCWLFTLQASPNRGAKRK